MNFIFIPGEHIAKEEDNVWYLGGHSEFMQIMIGHLAATAEHLTYYQKRPTYSKTLETVKVAFTIPVSKLIAAKFEKRFRSSSSKPKWENLKVYNKIVNGVRPVNSPPALLDGKEIYNVLILAIQGDSQIENLIFEVSDPLG